MNFGQIKVWFKDIINLLDKYIYSYNSGPVSKHINIFISVSIAALSFIVLCAWQTQMVFQKLHQDQIHVM